eukprot:jgi/Tetstr1/426091/TSEL_016422.t2
MDYSVVRQMAINTVDADAYAWVPVRVAYKLGRCSFALLPPPPSSAIPIPHPSLTFGCFCTPGALLSAPFIPHPVKMSGAKFTWMAKEAYPLFVTIGGGCLLCAFQLARSVAVNPDVSVMKSTRAQCIPEDWDAEKNGSAFHEHAVRRFVREYAGAGIFKDLNIAMSKPTA